jgi:hypothetical protein
LPSAARRVPLYVNPLTGGCEDLLYILSRPALRAVACGGRPRAGNDATVTGEPTAPGERLTYTN